MFLVNKVRSFLGGQAKQETLGEKRQRRRYKDDEDVTDCLQTPPSKRAKFIQVNKGVTSSSSPFFQKVNEGLLNFKRWSDRYLWKYVVSEETGPNEDEEEHIVTSTCCETDMNSQFKRSSPPLTYQSSVTKHRVQSSKVHIKQKEDDPNENKRTKQEWNKSFSSSALQTSTPLSYRPVWDVEKLEKTFLENDKDSYFGKKYNANKYKETSKQTSWKPSSQLSFSVGENTLSTSGRIGGKVRIRSSRAVVDRLKRIESFRRYQTTAEKAIRLKERDRYRQLVAQHTTVDNVGYDFSKSTTNNPENSLFVAPVRETQEKQSNLKHIHSGSLISSHSSLLPPSTPLKPYSPPTSPKLYSTPVVKVVASPRQIKDDSTSHVQDVQIFSNPGPFEEMPKRSYSTRSHFQAKQFNQVFEGDWIKKWKDALSPESLAREREKVKEERKLAELKAKEQEELKAIEDKVKERIRRKELGLPDEDLEGSFEGAVDEEFPVLTDEMEQQVDKALAPGNPDDPLVEGFRITLKRGDVATLGNLNWLNDEVINFYFSLLVTRSEEPNRLKVYSFNSFFYPKLIKTGYATLRRWTKKVDIFAMDIVFVPVHLGMHWCLAAIDFRKKTITYYDSLKGSNHRCLSALRNYLCEESKDKKKQPFELNGWTDSCPKDIPEQLNGCDCGVFTCKYAEYLSRDVPLNFTQHDMPYFRRRMIYEMINKKLM